MGACHRCKPRPNPTQPSPQGTQLHVQCFCTTEVPGPYLKLHAVLSINCGQAWEWVPDRVYVKTLVPPGVSDPHNLLLAVSPASQQCFFAFRRRQLTGLDSKATGCILLACEQHLPLPCSRVQGG